VIGKKIGLTSRDVQEMFGVNQPDVGFLTDQMAYCDGATLSLSQIGRIQPRAEGEIAFVLARDLAGANVTRDEVTAATEAVIPCFEIVDSRSRDWKIKIQDRSRTTPRAACSCSATHEPNLVRSTLHRRGSRCFVTANQSASAAHRCSSRIRRLPAEAGDLGQCERSTFCKESRKQHCPCGHRGMKSSSKVNLTIP
jgi:2-oxopent-4-enoate/cis-2-oxohex-4-enoate hydratase